MDTVSAIRRSEIMSRVRGKDTQPELLVRRLVHGMGYRYRLHVRALPGCPDLVFVARKKVVLVHGCFWHRHAGCALARLPKSRQAFWIPKLEANHARDERNARELGALGWDMLTVWECELPNITRLKQRIRRFLNA
jgi:DNA mismatch endonuclease (patch repair protein)